MNILVIGGGSMGRRRIRDAMALRPGQVCIYEPDGARCDEVSRQFGITGYDDLDTALAKEPNVLIVSTPPALHDQYIDLAVQRSMHVFAELPFVFNAEMLTDLSHRSSALPIVFGVSATIRYYPPFRLIHDLICDGAIGRPMYLEYSLGNYLPDWHPHEDYRKFYAKADPKAGGSGVDMILHELHAIQWWLGPIASLATRLSKNSDLEIAGPDSHDALITFQNGCRGYFHHDVIEQGTRGRHIRLAGDTGTIEWSQHEPEIRIYESANKSARNLPFNQARDWDEAMRASQEMTQILARTSAKSGAVPSGNQAAFTYESCYLREMQHFLDSTDGKHPYTLTTLEEELHNVRTFHRFLDSGAQHTELEV